MLSAQQTRSGIPAEQQSVLPTVRGVPWWGAVAIALALTVIGAVIDASGKGELATTYRVLYFVGCVAAVLAVRRRSLFTAVAQTPLIAFGVALVTLYALESGSGSGLRDLIINVLLPIAKTFPLMAWTFLVVLALGLGRFFLTRSHVDETPKRAKRRAPSGRSARAARTEKASRPSSRSAARRDPVDEPGRPARREAPTKHSSSRDSGRPRRPSDEPTRVPPTRRRVDSPSGRDPMRSAPPRDDVPRDSRPRPSGHRRSGEPPSGEPLGREPRGRESLGRLEPRRPRPGSSLDDLRPASAPRARYRGANP